MAVETFWDGLERRIAAGEPPHGEHPDGTPAGVTAEALRRVLDLEAHHLRRPGSAPVAQHLLAGAVLAGEAALAGAARARLTAQGVPALTTRWRTRPPSPALSRVLEGRGDAVVALLAGPDGVLLSLDASGESGAWDAGTGRAVPDPVAGPDGPRPVPSAARARTLALSPDGGLLALAGDDPVVRVLATDGPARGAEVTALAGRPGPVTALAVTGSARTRVVAGGADGAVRVWDVTSGAAVSVAHGHTGPVTALAVTGDGTVVSGGVDGTLRCWDPATGTPLGLLEGGPAVVAVALPAPGQLLAATSDGALHVFALVHGVPQDPVRLDVPGDGVAVTAAARAGEGRVVVGRVDGTVQLVPTTGPGPVAELAGHGAAVRSVAADAEGTVVVSGDDRGRVLVWDPVRARPGTGGHHGVSPAVGAVAATAGLVVSAGRRSDGLLAHDPATGARRWGVPAGAGRLWFDPSGTRLFAVTGTATVEERYATTGVRAGAVSLPGRVLAGRGALVVTGEPDGTVAVRDARSGRALRTTRLPSAPRVAAPTPGGATVLLAADGLLTCWRPASAEVLAVELPVGLVTAVAVDDDGCHGVVCDADGRVHVWRTGSPEVTTVRADAAHLTAAAGAAGCRAVTTGSDGAAVLWDLTAAAARSRVPLDAPLTGVAVGGGTVVVGDGCGEVHCLDLLTGVADVPDGAIPEQGAPAVVPAPRTGTTDRETAAQLGE
ncbi:WD40 repeat domain-containing protein [Pseudonocardia sp. ICBG1293]|uniref:WD40 repeat domain-containing protein n=1 Tax=Pseudonocardia sp. ICBG1293 TaxID=2844382 RepID=UPI001CCA789B|nr:PQQ-binding-like beta-propeller repeat protein [Pseudonocardia sp. ICBG1293]